MSDTTLEATSPSILSKIYRKALINQVQFEPTESAKREDNPFKTQQIENFMFALTHFLITGSAWVLTAALHFLPPENLSLSPQVAKIVEVFTGIVALGLSAETTLGLFKLAFAHVSLAVEKDFDSVKSE